MKKTIVLLGIIASMALIGFTFAACDNGNSGNGSGKLHNIDIVGARALMVVPGNAISRSARNTTNSDVFLKQLDDGSWVEVTMTSEEGGELKIEPPSYILDATEDWMVIGFKIPQDVFFFNNGNFWYHDGNNDIIKNIDDNDVGYYLVSKISGNVFNMKPVLKQFGFHLSNGNFYGNGQPYYQVDKNGNIYYMATRDSSDDFKIVKISIGTSQATAERLTSEVISVTDFKVDNDGNIVYSFYASYGNGHRIRTSNGTVFSIDDLKPNGLFSFNGNIYANIATDSSNSNDLQLYKLDIKGDSYDSIQYTPVFINGLSRYFHGNFYYFPDKMAIVDYSGSTILSFYKDGTYESIAVNMLFYNVKTGSKDFFVLANNELCIVDPKTGVKTTLMPNGLYDAIFHFEVTYNDIVIINALTFDGKKIFANIFPDGRKEIVSEDFEISETVILQKVR